MAGWSEGLKKELDELLERALEEDRAAEDATTELTVEPGLRARATILARQPMVVCGVEVARRTLEAYARLDKQAAAAEWSVEIADGVEDGAQVGDGQPLVFIRHTAGVLLRTERTILNLMQHLSGIATATRAYVRAINGTGARVLDTRKTIPGLRRLEKYAVATGGGTNHRLDLADAILIKNNHIALGGGVGPALARALAGRKAGVRVQVEVRTDDELEAALAGGAESILLDNMTPEETAAAVARIRVFSRGRAPIAVESSGGIVLGTIREYAEAGVDFISVGALTHSARAADISMRIEAE